MTLTREDGTESEWDVALTTRGDETSLARVIAQISRRGIRLVRLAVAADEAGARVELAARSSAETLRRLVLSFDDQPHVASVTVLATRRLLEASP